MVCQNLFETFETFRRELDVVTSAELSPSRRTQRCSVYFLERMRAGVREIIQTVSSHKPPYAKGISCLTAGDPGVEATCQNHIEVKYYIRYFCYFVEKHFFYKSDIGIYMYV